MANRKTKAAPVVPEPLTFSTGNADTLRYTCTLVTPMYGGGVTAGEVDKAMPIRATAIRGQLRHWWRLLNRKDANGNKELFEAERAIWGGLGNENTLAKSKVVVRVETKPAVRLQAVGQNRKNKKGNDQFYFDKSLEDVAYVLFPAAPNDKKKEIGNILPAGHSFTLDILRRTGNPTLSETEWTQVQEAVRWWASFGGVGARTRRGCGAVQVLNDRKQLLLVSAEEVELRNWRLVLGRSGSDAVAAWEQATKAIKTFRQGVGIGRNGTDEKHPKRSNWPEADAIRRITSQRSRPHSKPFCDIGDVFPRAAFGLPIITHFKDYGKRNPTSSDPADTTLKPIPPGEKKSVERMASPLILRPYNGGHGWQPAVLCLDTDHIDEMGLLLEGTPLRILRGQWQAGDKAKQIQPMQGRGGDALQAFLAYFAEQANKASDSKAPAPRQQKIKKYTCPNISKRGATIRVKSKEQAPRNVTGADAERLYGDLSDYAKQQLDAGKQFNRLDITFDGFKYVELKEYQA